MVGGTRIMDEEEIKIITFGDIFRNLETEEQAFEFLKYIKNLQQENKQLKDKFNQILEEINCVTDLIDTYEYVDTNAINIYKIIKGDSNE